jgi:hypothetical protein
VTNLKVSDAFVIDFRRQQQFERIVSHEDAIGKLDDGKPDIEQFKNGFLPFSLEHVADHEDGLAFSLRPQIL